MRLSKGQRGFLIRAGHPTCTSTIVLGAMTSRTVRALERRGLVEVEPGTALFGSCRTGRRSLLVHLTDAGWAEAGRLRADLASSQ